MDKEKLKIISFSSTNDDYTVDILNKLSSKFKTSNRRLIQFALAYSYNILSLPKPERNYTKAKKASTVFIPFTDKGLAKCEDYLKKNNITFKDICIQAINNVYSDSVSIKLNKNKFFYIYISQNLQEFIDSQI